MLWSTDAKETATGRLARRYVASALQEGLGLETPDDFARPSELSDEDVAAVIAIVKRNRIGGLVRSGVSRSSLPLPEALAQFLEAQQRAAIAKNLENLIETHKVSALLDEAGINFVVMKGAVRSYEVFGGLDTRPSNDIDVLVSQGDYERAGELLCDNGYLRGVAHDDRWWHEHLGESPFLPTRSRCIVDVHYKVQQPGGPRPSNMGDFLANRTTIWAANRMFWILHPDHALLLTYISVSKAMRNGEHWLGYAAEITKAQSQMSARECAQFYAMARRQGLSRMLSQIDSVIDKIFAMASPLEQEADRDNRIHELAQTAFGSHAPPQRYLHRSRLLWQWTRGSGCQRVARFMGLTTERVISDWRRPRSTQTASINQ